MLSVRHALALVRRSLARRRPNATPERIRRVAPWLLTGPALAADEYAALAASGVTHVADLRAEARDDEAHMATLGLRWRRFPIPDGSAPTAAIVEELAAWLAGEPSAAVRAALYLHCQGGIQRTPTVAAALLIERGLALGEAMRTIHVLEPRTMLTEPQRAWLETFAATRAGANDGTGILDASVPNAGEAPGALPQGEPERDRGEPEARQGEADAHGDATGRRAVE